MRRSYAYCPVACMASCSTCSVSVLDLLENEEFLHWPDVAEEQLTTLLLQSGKIAKDNSFASRADKEASSRTNPHRSREAVCVTRRERAALSQACQATGIEG